MMLVFVVSTVLFFVCALFATIIHLTGPKASRSPRWSISLFIAPVLGALSALVLAAVPTLLIAIIYKNLGVPLSEGASYGWGLGLGLFIALVNAGAFQRVV